MSANRDLLEELTSQEYQHGFVTPVESESFRPGLSEEIVRAISARKNEPEWLLEWRLKAYRHWLTMTEPAWARSSRRFSGNPASRSGRWPRWVP